MIPAKFVIPGVSTAEMLEAIAQLEPLTAAGFDPSQPRDPGGEGGGRWVKVAGLAEAERRRKEGDKNAAHIPGLPSGMFTPEDKVKFWPERMGAYSGFKQDAPYGPFWKAWLDRDGNEVEFWFVTSEGSPHHGNMMVAMGEFNVEKSRWHRVSGYGVHADTQRAQIPEEWGDRLVRRHRRDIRDANAMLDEREQDASLAAAAYVEAEHPRHPAGSEQGGEWAPKGAMLAVVRQEETDRAASLRRKPGQGTRHTRTTEPVMGPDGEWLTGTRDALLIQADEFFATLSDEEQARIALYAGSDDRKLELYANYTRNRLADLTSIESGAKVAVRVPQETIVSILDRGAVLNAHDAAHLSNDRSSKDAYMTGRTEAERSVWSIDTDDPGAHPIYGYVATDNEVVGESLARAFGDTKLTLDDSVRPRTTITYSDSLFVGIGDGDVVPSPIDSPSEMSVVSWMNLGGVEVPVAYKGQEPRPLPTLSAETEKKITEAVSWFPEDERADAIMSRRIDEAEKLGYRRFRSGDFIEAQIHGGVTIRDITRVDFSSGPGQDILDRLDEAGIPWTIGGPE